MTVSERKAALRALASERRRGTHDTVGAAAGEQIRDHFLAALGNALPGPTVAGYWPMRSEADPRPLLEHLHESGFTCALPVVEAPRRPLLFRRWRPHMALEPGAYGERIPGPEAEAVAPSTLLVPLLAFDRSGYRLGYGGGFYDRTIAQLRRTTSVLAVGLAFAAQEVERVPRDRRDRRLDWVVTEADAFRVGA